MNSINIYAEVVKTHMETKQKLKNICEQKIYSISYLHPNQKIKFNDWYMKIVDGG